MEYLREWASDEERAKAARQLREEALVWMKVMVEHSPTAGRADPLAVVRQAFADAVDEQWSGRMLDLATFGGGSVHTALRLSCSMLLGPTVRSLLRVPVSGSGSAFTAPLRQTAGNRVVGPDLIVVVGNPQLTVPKQLPKGALNAKFMIGTLGDEPGAALQQLAEGPGSTAMALRDEADARFFSSIVCKAFLALAASGGGHVSQAADAEQHFDGHGHGPSYATPSGYVTGERSYALGENDSPHGLSTLEYREPRRESSGPYRSGGYGGAYGGYDDDF